MTTAFSQDTKSKFWAQLKSNCACKCAVCNRKYTLYFPSRGFLPSSIFLLLFSGSMSSFSCTVAASLTLPRRSEYKHVWEYFDKFNINYWIWLGWNLTDHNIQQHPWIQLTFITLPYYFPREKHYFQKQRNIKKRYREHQGCGHSGSQCKCGNLRWRAEGPPGWDHTVPLLAWQAPQREASLMARQKPDSGLTSACLLFRQRPQHERGHTITTRKQRQRGSTVCSP